MSRNHGRCPCRLPRRRLGANGLARSRARGRLVGRYPGWRIEGSFAFPGRCFRRLSSGFDEGSIRLPLRGQRRVAGREINPLRFLLPVELRHANHTASTNAGHFSFKSFTKIYNGLRMASSQQLEQLVDRVERLLVRYEELQRTNALLAEQVELLTQERDSLKSRLSAARSRVDALLERLPEIKSAA